MIHPGTTYITVFDKKCHCLDKRIFLPVNKIIRKQQDLNNNRLYEQFEYN